MPWRRVSAVSRGDHGRARVRGGRAQLSLTTAVWIAVVASAVPILSVISPGSWMTGVLLVPAVVLAAGFAARWAGLGAPSVSAIEAGVWIVVTVGVFVPFPLRAVIGSSDGRVASIPQLFGDSVREIVTGTAPLPPTTALSFSIVAATGALAVLIDHVAITTRMPLAAGIGLIAVSLVPSVAVPAPFDTVAFVLLAAAMLFLMRAETRTRFTPPRATPTAPSSTSAIALSIGVVAILVAVGVTPLLPQPQARAGAGGPGGSRIDASLNMGRDLRQPNPVTVLTYTTTAPTPPYLRVATLSDFTGGVWKPDELATTPLRGGVGFRSITTGEDISRVVSSTTIHIDALTSQYLPVPFAATAVTGIQRGWQAMSDNHTVVSDVTTTSTGMKYTVSSVMPDPTLEQIQASTAHGVNADTALPAHMPAIILRDAEQVTRGTHDDYDALIALQDWFRGPEFTYSLTTPTRDGYDATGVQDVADFLRVKEGYCIHFASAFALMARALGMNSRIVVGYLPGGLNATSAAVGGVPEYEVSSSSLHAWVEVDFRGIGWIPFDPTKSLGTPTAFEPAVAAVGTGVAPESGPAQAPEPAATPTGPASQQREAAQSTASPAQTATALPLWWWGVGGAVLLLLLCTPAVLVAVRRRRQDAAARAGDVLAAWASVCGVAIDLGIPVPAGESPRAFAARLAHEHGAPPDVWVLLDAVEQTSYAAPGTPVDAVRCAQAAAAVRTGLYLAVPGRHRVRAMLAPRSVFVRPGSEYARSGTPSATR